VDGLFDPGAYLERLQSRASALRPDTLSTARPLYIVVEKILGPDERLPEWPVAGTTGYDFLAIVNGLFVDRGTERAMTDAAERFTRMRLPFDEIAYRGKQLILRVSMSSELSALAFGLKRFSERSRHYRDFTLNSLNQAMREIIACFPVYRTYVNDREDVSERDRGFIDRAVRQAKRRNPNRPPAVYDFIHDLLVKEADYLLPAERDEHMRFVGRFQQVTSPVTAKGIEDTALYIYNRLVSLNEVGGSPDRFGTPPAALHTWLSRRSPHGLSATSTHDTKRSEDVRARIDVLADLAEDWKAATSRWARLNRRGRSLLDGQSYPSRNDEYLLYQTLVGTWPLQPMDGPATATYRERIVGYMHKAMREAKIYTSWLNPSDAHEQAMTRFVDFVLASAHVAFRADFEAFAQRVSRHGIHNSLAQLAIKIGAPGVPDFYQGTEIWDFTLVDPDNRRPVDYGHRRALLADLDAALVRDGTAAVASRLAADPFDDRLKLYATTMMLRLRREEHAIFDEGSYRPLATSGMHGHRVFAFARSLAGRHAVVAVPRLTASFNGDWGDTRIELPEASAFRELFTGRYPTPDSAGPAPPSGDGLVTSIRAAELFTQFPIAVLRCS
jgi:(1->4)-alpha-D-glucan 1-alpha-D-glucosylmutase